MGPHGRKIKVCAKFKFIAKVLQKKVRPTRGGGAGACLCYYDALTHTGTPRTHPQPHTEHRKYAVKGRAVQGGSDARRLDDRTDARIARRTRTPSAACILPANREGKGAGTWGPWRKRGDSEASERSERARRARRGGVRALLFSWPTAPRSPGRRRSLPSSCGGKVWDPPPVNIVLWDRARVCKGHVAGPGHTWPL